MAYCYVLRECWLGNFAIRDDAVDNGRFRSDVCMWLHCMSRNETPEDARSEYVERLLHTLQMCGGGPPLLCSLSLEPWGSRCFIHALTSRHLESRWQTGKEGIRRLQAQRHGLYGGQGE